MDGQSNKIGPILHFNAVNSKGNESIRISESEQVILSFTLFNIWCHNFGLLVNMHLYLFKEKHLEHCTLQLLWFWSRVEQTIFQLVYAYDMYLYPELTGIEDGAPPPCPPLLPFPVDRRGTIYARARTGRVHKRLR